MEGVLFMNTLNYGVQFAWVTYGCIIGIGVYLLFWYVASDIIISYCSFFTI